ncbi:hypothetical protein NXU96_21335 [Phocaeicola vulgatus]|uniref:hypothetical protein n=1 Tax=Phocaeicola vulgatus TaxID=821 RepID=UPI002164F9D4|nr:hypothetical protein [Phocaeicola vulgatus]MCS2662886.1 hypothetical protein [Phocaeicola vulgatus]MCS2701529.1 hypothetical protein [Phocaeicola vulgatus]MCS3019807.1 hypothetical protein [Phocaeicola vulgatus]MCS3141508.1 hypothetical protein [Phocaeicola vulgatus]MCS3234195.1 hypothetical protein [Phocaeicola vulgatus]
MKQVKFLLLAAFVAMFTGCQNEEIMEQDSEKDEPVPTGDTRIIIEGEGMLETSARSSDGRVDFTGGMPLEQDCMTDAKMFLLKPILMQDMR